MPGVSYDKFPDEVVEFDLDCSDILLDGDTIQSVTVPVLSGGISVSGIGFSSAIVTFLVSGGTAGQVAKAVAQVTLMSGQYRETVVSIVIKPAPGA